MRNFDVSFSKHLKCYEILIAGEWLFNVEYSLLSCSIPSQRFIPSSFCPLFRVLSPFPFPQFCVYPLFRVLSSFPRFIPFSVFYPIFRSAIPEFRFGFLSLPYCNSSNNTYDSNNTTYLHFKVAQYSLITNNSGVQQLPPLIKLRIFGFCGADIGMFKIF